VTILNKVHAKDIKTKNPGIEIRSFTHVFHLVQNHINKSPTGKAKISEITVTIVFVSSETSFDLVIFFLILLVIRVL
jgi:uncharacterized protein YaaN involved in tellurite resistance